MYPTNSQRGARDAVQLSPVSFFAAWQPLKNEDAQTALVFGYLRHAPPETALSPWLSEVLGRRVRCDPLDVADFWPTYKSMIAGRLRTTPELVFTAEDSDGDVTVVVEAKRVPEGHEVGQLIREAIDAATDLGSTRLALVMVGVDAGRPKQMSEWKASIGEELEGHGLSNSGFELHYSSWARVGRWIVASGEGVPELQRYASDAASQLARNGLLGYTGAPMTDDLGELTVLSAFALANRTTKQARLFFLTLLGENRFSALALEPVEAKPSMLRDGVRARSLTREEGWFETTTLLSHFHKPAWEAGVGVFVAFFVAGERQFPELAVGAYAAAEHAPDLQNAFAWAGPAKPSKLTRAGLMSASASLLSETAYSDYRRVQWRYGLRNWIPGKADEDLAWTLDALEEATAIWDEWGETAAQRLRKRAQRRGPGPSPGQSQGD